jgi:RNA polymerase sigma factor (sigma-70 family)
MSDDDRYVRATLQGDSAAYETLVERYAATLAGIAFARTGLREAAADVAQETLCEAYERLGTLNDPARFGPWICRMAANKAISWVRRKGAERRALEERRIEREDRQPPRSPFAAAAEDEELARVLAAMESLSEADREVLMLRYYNGLGRAETAELLEIRPAALDKRLQRALERLQRELEIDP